jgi:integrase
MSGNRIYRRIDFRSLRKAKSDKTCSLVFPTGGCNPKLDFLDCLKAVAERAKLDRDDFWLHRFRATFATRCSGRELICASTMTILE